MFVFLKKKISHALRTVNKETKGATTQNIWQKLSELQYVHNPIFDEQYKHNAVDHEENKLDSLVYMCRNKKISKTMHKLLCTVICATSRLYLFRIIVIISNKQLGYKAGVRIISTQ